MMNKNIKSEISKVSTLYGIKKLIKKYPKIDDEVIISLYYTITNHYPSEISGMEITSWIEARITGHAPAIDVENMLDFLSEHGYDWLDYSIEYKMQVLATSIKSIL